MISVDVDKWIDAIMEEQHSLEKQGTWEVYNILLLLKDRKAVGTNRVFIVHLNQDGSIERYKARLVVTGYVQISGIDYSETFVPVTLYDSLHLLLAIIALYNLDTAQLDIKLAFTYSPLDEEIWISPSIEIGLNNNFLLLKKALRIETSSSTVVP